MARLNGIIAALEKGQTAFGTFAPADVERLRERHRGVEFTLHNAVGELPPVIDAMADAAKALLPD